jgi:hypothetical protein
MLEAPAAVRRSWVDVGELVDAVLPRGARAASLIMLAAYLDESGTDLRTKPALVVAGYLAPVSSWRRLERGWRTLLKKERVTVFHRTDMEGCQGEFAKWNALGGSREVHRQRVLKDCHRLIRRARIKGIAYAINQRDFARHIPSKLEDRYGSAYAICAGVCAEELANWSLAKGYHELIAFVFESGVKGAAKAMASIEEKLRPNAAFGSITLAAKQKVLSLQAADFFAYEACRHIENELAGRPRPPRKSALDLIDMRFDEVLYLGGSAIAGAKAAIDRRRLGLG